MEYKMIKKKKNKKQTDMGMWMQKQEEDFLITSDRS
jgi:hypothetical protein